MTAADTPTPTPSQGAGTATVSSTSTAAPITTDVSPGVAGFLAFFVLAVALYLLMRNMNGRMRRMSYRQTDAGRTGEQAQATEQDAVLEDDIRLADRDLGDEDRSRD